MDVPDDDQYDTEDSFIDDAELVGTFNCSLHPLNFFVGICAAVSSSTIIVWKWFSTMKRLTLFVKIFLLQDEYFEVDNSAIKHDGFFVNRGKLERMWVTSEPF